MKLQTITSLAVHSLDLSGTMVPHTAESAGWAKYWNSLTSNMAGAVEQAGKGDVSGALSSVVQKNPEIVMSILSMLIGGGAGGLLGGKKGAVMGGVLTGLFALLFGSSFRPKAPGSVQPKKPGDPETAAKKPTGLWDQAKKKFGEVKEAGKQEVVDLAGDTTNRVIDVGTKRWDQNKEGIGKDVEGIISRATAAGTRSIFDTVEDIGKEYATRARKYGREFTTKTGEALVNSIRHPFAGGPGSQAEWDRWDKRSSGLAKTPVQEIPQLPKKVRPTFPSPSAPALPPHKNKITG